MIIDHHPSDKWFIEKMNEVVDAPYIRQCAFYLWLHKYKLSLRLAKANSSPGIANCFLLFLWTNKTRQLLVNISFFLSFL